MSTADQLRDAAKDAFDSGRLEDALAHFLELERLENDPEWARRAAQAHHRLNDTAGEVAALNRAAKLYQTRGDILKAAVTSKLILALDPAHEETLRRIPELVERRTKELEGKPRAIQSMPTPSAPAAAQKIAKVVSSFYHADLLPRVPSGIKGVSTIPLKGDIAPELELDILIEEPEEAPLGADPLRVDDAGNIVTSTPPPAPPAKPTSATYELRTNDLGASGRASDALKDTLFVELVPETFTALLMQAKVVELTNGQELFHQGDAGDTMYVIASGTLGVIDEGPPRKGIAKLREKRVFGEIALLTNQPRTASIVALSDATLIAIDRDCVSTLSAKDPAFLDVLFRFLRDRLVDRLLSNNPLFTVLSERDREVLKPRFKLLEVESGAVMIEEGKKPDGLVILLAGSADVVRKRNEVEVTLGRLSAGDIAGEISLLTNIPAIGSVRASERCLAVLLPAAAFHTIVHARPDAMSFIQRLIDQRTEQAKAILSGAAPHVEGRVLGSP